MLKNKLRTYLLKYSRTIKMKHWIIWISFLIFLQTIIKETIYSWFQNNTLKTIKPFSLKNCWNCQNSTKTTKLKTNLHFKTSETLFSRCFK